MKRWAGAVVAAAVTLASCGSTGTRPSAISTAEGATTVPAAIPTDPLPAGSSAALLATAGIATVADEASAVPVMPVSGTPSPLTVTAWQASTFDAEAAGGQGMFGVDLDSVAPLAAGLPSMSYLVAAWLRRAGDPAVDAAHRAMPAATDGAPPQWRFPTIVLTLFAADVAAHADEGGTDATVDTGAGLRAPPAAGELVARRALDGPCSTVAGFVDATLDKVFDALHIDAAAAAGYASGVLGGGTAGAVGGAVTGWLAGLVNDAIDLARDAVEGLIATITKPVVDAIRTAIGAVAVVTTVVSYLKRWQAPVSAPNDPDRFAVGDEPDRNGSLTVQVDSSGETDDWPPLLKDCAAAVGLDLPSLSKEHMPVTWRVLWQSAPDLVTFHADGPPYRTELDRSLASTLTYTTGREDSDAGHVVTSGDGDRRVDPAHRGGRPEAADHRLPSRPNPRCRPWRGRTDPAVVRRPRPRPPRRDHLGGGFGAAARQPPRAA